MFLDGAFVAVRAVLKRNGINFIGSKAFQQVIGSSTIKRNMADLFRSQITTETDASESSV